MLYVQLCTHIRIQPSQSYKHQYWLESIDVSNWRGKSQTQKSWDGRGDTDRKWMLNMRLNVIEMKFSLHAISDSDFIAHIQTGIPSFIAHIYIYLCLHTHTHSKMLWNIYMMCANWTSAHRFCSISYWKYMYLPNKEAFQQQNIAIFPSFAKISTNFSLITTRFRSIATQHLKVKRER